MFKSAILKYLTLSVLLVFLTTISVMAQATTTTTSTTTPLDTNIGSSCVGELIHVTGQLHVVMRTTTTPSGFTAREFHINLHGSGEGFETGNQYEFMQTTNLVFNRPDDTPLEFTLAETVHIVSHGSNNDFRVRTLIHVAINANGEVSAQINEFDRVCD
jgi:hypothetical protein